MDERSRDRLLTMLERQQHTDQERQEANKLFLQTVSEMSGAHHDPGLGTSARDGHNVDRKSVHPCAETAVSPVGTVGCAEAAKLAAIV